ncbi:TPA: hypothetical protein H1012_01280 [archaeon]|nr:hypothetical protein [Candidatus Naiadarchaeales archaeon SRR2090153.bin461]HIK02460.1 hypothetical protein [Candidatus Naiadarchaeales archaeon SRR2090159.bin1288]
MAQKTLEHLHKDIEDMKNDIAVIKHILTEEYELSEEGKKRLAEAEKTPRSEYITLEEARKRLKA